jgi:hypothetical protein
MRPRCPALESRSIGPDQAVHGDLSSGCHRPQPARLAVDRDARRRLARLQIRTRRSFRNDLPVKLHRHGVGMNLDNANLAAPFIGVFDERYEPRFSVIDLRAISQERCRDGSGETML